MITRSISRRLVLAGTLAVLTAMGPTGCAYLGEGITPAERGDILEKFTLEHWQRVEVSGVVITSSLPPETVTGIAHGIDTFVRLIDEFVFPGSRRDVSKPIELTLFGSRAHGGGDGVPAAGSGSGSGGAAGGRCRLPAAFGRAVNA